MTSLEGFGPCTKPIAAAGRGAVDSDSVPAQSRERFSELLDRITHPGSADRISFGDVLESVGDRAFGALLLVFAIPNTIAGAVPGVSALLGLPLMLLSLQLVIGAPRPWLPPRIRARTAKRADLARVVGFVRRPCQWVERLLKPRLLILTSSWAERCIGAVCALAACVLFLPIPFANLLPAVTLCLFGLALLERDGMFVVMGTAAFALTIVALGGGIYSLQELATDTWPMAFGTP